MSGSRLSDAVPPDGVMSLVQTSPSPEWSVTDEMNAALCLAPTMTGIHGVTAW